MKKIYLTITFLIFIVAISKAQWTTSGTTIYYNTGSVGIGTANPSSQLAISGTSSTNPNNTGAEILYSALTFQNLSSGGLNYIVGRISSIQENGNYIDAGSLAFSTGVAGLYERMRINTAGNILIGKTTQTNTGYKLDVNGNIRANAITVNSTGADFVFDPVYKLMPLADLSEYLKNNNHLPGVASAKQMQTDGLNLGDNQTKLLQKVEELTLYVIEKDEQLKKQQAQIDLLIKQVAELSKSK
jgi:hypothetical protein